MRVIKSSGQGMTEYIVILALVVVSAIGVYSLFGKTLRNQIAGVAQEISGQSANDSLSEAQDAADDAEDSAAEDYGLADYDESNEGDGD
ncbi:MULTISPECIES: Flp family type IVb pilin [Gammaproteobacteria]|uniref:Flp family type IVb pilin n=1 Tax=Gammaproteobacteria TaxID=1236 RepID=UPI000DCFC1F8|nr:MULTISPECIES: pilus assembly protein [Gammaproteobacteria]RTE87409.1 pilus assembly protein [Aliidiomarina sp. B3213]TCZ92805.1 pilus assembly protein [Lysobacter sp. N42]